MTGQRAHFTHFDAAGQARMVDVAGSIDAGPAGLHFVRAMACYVLDEYRAGRTPSAASTAS